MAIDDVFYTNDTCQRIEQRRVNEGGSAIGLAVYRCTYDSNEDWKTFLDIFRARIRLALTDENATDLEGHVDWVVFDERELDGASILDVRRRHYQGWAATQIANDGVWDACELARYNYFVYVDKDVLQSVIAPVDIDPRYGFDTDRAYLKLVEARRFVVHDEDDSPEEDLATCYVHVSLLTFFPGAYYIIDEMTGWDTYYEDPPTLVFR